MPKSLEEVFKKDLRLALFIAFEAGGIFDKLSRGSIVHCDYYSLFKNL